jgi:FkbM family methyltransferase
MSIQKTKKMKYLYWSLAVSIAGLLKGFKINLDTKIHQKLSQRVLFLRIINRLHEYGNELVHIRGDQFKIPELDHIFSLDGSAILALRSYFKEKQRMHFFTSHGNIYAKVKDLVFLLPFPHGIYELAEVFYENCYAGFDLSSATVIDIGAFIGDSSIYFACKGARKIIAYEPLPQLHEIATTNILINKFKDKIRIKNEAIGDRYGETIIYEPIWPGGSSTFLCREREIVRFHKAKVTPLSDVILDQDQVDLLKIDCEGCELKALKEAYEKKALKKVKQTIIEVHCDLQYVLDILQKAHFKVQKVKGLEENLPILVYAREKNAPAIRY